MTDFEIKRKEYSDLKIDLVARISTCEMLEDRFLDLDMIDAAHEVKSQIDDYMVDLKCLERDTENKYK